MTITNQIFELNAPYNNPYQGNDKRLLFVCSVCMLRSPTAADIATKLGYNARSCGSDVSCALIPLSANLIVWADEIIFINHENYSEAVGVFERTEELFEMMRKARLWNITDSYDRNQPKLIAEIMDEMKRTGIIKE